MRDARKDRSRSGFTQLGHHGGVAPGIYGAVWPRGGRLKCCEPRSAGFSSLVLRFRMRLTETPTIYGFIARLSEPRETRETLEKPGHRCHCSENKGRPLTACSHAAPFSWVLGAAGGMRG